MKDKIDKIFENNYFAYGEYDVEKIKDEILALFAVGQSFKCIMESDKPNCTCKLNECLKQGW